MTETPRVANVNSKQTKSDCGVPYITLSERNFARGSLTDGKQLLVLFDSGASKTLISASTVFHSKHLTSLPKKNVGPTRFRLGNGQYIVCDSTITFSSDIQGNLLQVTAFVAPN